MERPKILLGIEGDTHGYADALTHAGFQPLEADPSAVAVADMAVIDCDLHPDVVTSVYQAVRAARSIPVLLLVGTETELPESVGGPGDEVALKPLPPDALVYRLQALDDTFRPSPASGPPMSHCRARRSPAKAMSSASSLRRAGSARPPSR